MASAVQSPVAKQPPPAPKPRQGLMKSFNGSMLFLINSKTVTTETFETNDPERRGPAQNLGSRANSTLRPSDLGRSSASSFGSRGSFSGWFPLRTGSTPLEAQDGASREPSPATTPRTSLSRSLVEEHDADSKESRHSVTSAVFGTLKKTKNQLSRTIKSSLSGKRPSNLGKKEHYATGTNTIPEPDETSLPSFIRVIKPAATPVTTSVHANNVTMIEPTQLSSPVKPELLETMPRSAASTADSTSFVSKTSNDVVSPTVPEPLAEMVETTKEEIESDESDNDKNELLKAADLETIHVLAGRIGDRAAAKVVVRIARKAESWVREESNRLLNQPNASTPGSKRLSSGRKGESENDEVNVTCLFYGEKRPKIALDRYLGRLVRYLDSFCECGSGVQSMGILSLIGGVLLIDRLASRTNFNLDMMNTHRAFMVATLIALKMLDDEPCSNDYYANVGGVELSELNALEITFLKALDFEASIAPSEVRMGMSGFIGENATRRLFETWFEE